MKAELRNTIFQILGENRIMTIATNRPDGWPQATVVGYANDGLKIYFFVARTSQKYRNIVLDPRVSLAIAKDFAAPLEIRELSLSGNAAPVEDQFEIERVGQLMLERFSEYAAWPRPGTAISPLMCVRPKFISVVDYSRGFGHSDLVSVSNDELERHIETARHVWHAKLKPGK